MIYFKSHKKIQCYELGSQGEGSWQIADQQLKSDCWAGLAMHWQIAKVLGSDTIHAE